jgi:L-ascorbate metabolism protein UlaG (beta-lactamase superfamily)
MIVHTVRIVLPLALAAACSGAWAQNVKVTPLGSHTGELCARDRATIFEDPSGLRILYDAGQSVLGANDERLGKIDVVILSHAHGDHLGENKLKALDAGTCANPELVSAAPNSTTAEIAAAKNAAIVMATPLANFVARKVETISGKKVASCGPATADIVGPLTASCIAGTQTGGTRKVKASGTAKAVEITVVPAMHESTAPVALLSEASRKNLEVDNMSLTLGPANGYVIRFTNGLTAYLTGDSGLHSEMQTVERDFYKASLMQLNYGESALSPEGAAYAVNTLVQPASVVVSHVNEAATSGGKVKTGTRTAAFIDLVKGRPVYPAVSGKTMEFDGAGKCVAGC